ncbi:DUF5018 domain-containing protein, partial [Oceanirhabdus seepicola]
SSEKEIIGFTLAEQTGAADIKNGNHTVEIEVDNGKDVTNLTPTISVSDKATINPDSGVAQDFSNPVTYTVTAEDGTNQAWEVTVTEAAVSSNNTSITSSSYTINITNKTITNVPYGTSKSHFQNNISKGQGQT